MTRSNRSCPSVRPRWQSCGPGESPLSPRSPKHGFLPAVALPVLVAVLLLGGRVALAGGVPILTTTGGEVAVGGVLESSVILDNIVEPANSWSFTICHDPTVVALTSYGLGADALVVAGGEPPDFFQFEEEEFGWGGGVVISLPGVHTLPLGVFEIGRATYTGVAVGSTLLCPCDGIGTPPIATNIAYSGQSITPVFDCGTATVPPGPYLVRGDANHDGQIDLGDAIGILNTLFVNGPPLACTAAADANGDGSENIGDAVWLLNYLFVAGPPPVAPFPQCGAVPAADCVAGVVCP